MKWYSVKEHQPILSCCCLLLAVRFKSTNDITLWLGEWDRGWKDWAHKEDIEDEGLEVVYFCYPDPIPRVYEDLMSEQQKE